MKITEIITALEALAPPALQEDWDNGGLLTGRPEWHCSGVLCTLDATVAVVQEAVAHGCNLIVAHHPIIFKGLKQLTGKTYAEAVVVEAIKAGVAIYAAHTALDNVRAGVNGAIASRLGLRNCRVLAPRPRTLQKLVTFAPHGQADAVRNALFAAGGGHIGTYSECSFNSAGTGTFKAEAGAKPYVGEIGKRHTEDEVRIEVVFPAHLQVALVAALRAAHPYEEVAYDVLALENRFDGIGAGLVGELEDDATEAAFLRTLQNIFKTPCIRHTPLRGLPVKTVAVCGGSGAFLIRQAARQGAQVYITADVKYHEFFDADGNIVVADVGHWESEQHTADLLHSCIAEKFPTFAVRKSAVATNPVQYFM